MTVLPFNLANFSGGNTDTKKADGNWPEWVKPGAYVCTVTGLSNSAMREGYSGSPYVEFTLMTECGKQGRAKFWAIKETDKPSTQDWKKKQIKDFLMNCGVKDFSAGDEMASKDALNRRVQVSFNSEEYVARDKETNLPVKRTTTKYLWSSAMGKNITWDPKYNKTLSPEEEELVNGTMALKDKFEVEKVEQTPQQVVASSNSTIVDDIKDADLPF